MTNAAIGPVDAKCQVQLEGRPGAVVVYEAPDGRARVEVVVGGDTVARAKPHPDPLLHAAAAMQLPPSACLYLGDDLRDIQSARAAGMLAVAARYAISHYGLK